VWRIDTRQKSKELLLDTSHTLPLPSPGQTNGGQTLERILSNIGLVRSRYRRTNYTPLGAVRPRGHTTTTTETSRGQRESNRVQQQFFKLSTYQRLVTEKW
jgi:hypothetical protein